MINRMIASILPHMPKRMIWIFSKKYIAGEYLSDALRESKRLNDERCSVSIDILGEYVTKLAEAEQYKIQYISVIEQFLRQRNQRKLFTKTFHVWSFAG